MTICNQPFGEWLKEGHFISLRKSTCEHAYYTISQRELARYEWEWANPINPLTLDGPNTVSDMEITAEEGEQLWQFIFGFDKQVFVSVQLPTDIDRHGVAKRPKMTTSYPYVGNYEVYMSPFDCPSFITEHFLSRPDCQYPAFTIYNPLGVAVTPHFNFLINKLMLEKIGEEVLQGTRIALQPAQPCFAEVLDKLYRRVIPNRPITLYPVRAPAEARG